MKFQRAYTKESLSLHERYVEICQEKRLQSIECRSELADLEKCTRLDVHWNMARQEFASNRR